MLSYIIFRPTQQQRENPPPPPNNIPKVFFSRDCPPFKRWRRPPLGGGDYPPPPPPVVKTPLIWGTHRDNLFPVVCPGNINPGSLLEIPGTWDSLGNHGPKSQVLLPCTDRSHVLSCLRSDDRIGHILFQIDRCRHPCQFFGNGIQHRTIIGIYHF